MRLGLKMGQLLPISSNVALFTLLDTTYGGDGRTTFALPNLQAAAPNGLAYVICTEGRVPQPRVDGLAGRARGLSREALEPGGHSRGSLPNGSPMLAVGTDQPLVAALVAADLGAALVHRATAGLAPAYAAHRGGTIATWPAGARSTHDLHRWSGLGSRSLSVQPAPWVSSGQVARGCSPRQAGQYGSGLGLLVARGLLGVARGAAAWLWGSAQLLSIVASDCAQTVAAPGRGFVSLRVEAAL